MKQHLKFCYFIPFYKKEKLLYSNETVKTNHFDIFFIKITNFIKYVEKKIRTYGLYACVQLSCERPVDLL